MTSVENPVLLDIPEQFETDRLILRHFLDEDAEEMNIAISESIVELSQWLPWAREPQTLAQTQAFVRQQRANFILRNNFEYCLIDKQHGGYLGNCGVYSLNWGVPSFEIGYWIRTEEAGKGYVTEAVRFLTGYFVREVGAKRLLIRCWAENFGSAVVAKKSGYVLEGTQHRFMRNNEGQLVDVLDFVYLPEM